MFDCLLKNTQSCFGCSVGQREFVDARQGSREGPVSHVVGETLKGAEISVNHYSIIKLLFLLNVFLEYK